MILIIRDLDLVILRDLPIDRIFYCRRQKSKSDLFLKVIPSPKELNSNGAVSKFVADLETISCDSVNQW